MTFAWLLVIVAIASRKRIQRVYMQPCDVVFCLAYCSRASRGSFSWLREHHHRLVSSLSLMHKLDAVINCRRHAICKGVASCADLTTLIWSLFCCIISTYQARSQTTPISGGQFFGKAIFIVTGKRTQLLPSQSLATPPSWKWRHKQYCKRSEQNFCLFVSQLMTF